ncbi:hypothetical protein VTJ83DRAFT_2719 [Remersonia thermophila]|uniref:Uncharacterized protein n=1 Tax=Remersonia thermophila TaxID=72144 RepID=A0ABR4DJL8_9PEZI
MPASSEPGAVTAAARRILSDIGRRTTAHWTYADSDNQSGKPATTIVLLRAVANAVHLGFGVYYRLLGGGWTLVLWPVADQLVVAWAVSFVAEEQGERRVLGRNLTEDFFRNFLYVWATLHGLYLLLLAGLIVSFAYFFGATGSSVLTLLGLVILAVAWVASRPVADGEPGLVLP